jgi:transcriptional regulator GlxA family with amidase domain
MRTATIVVFDQFTDIDVFLPWDLLNRAKRLVPDWQVKLVGTHSTHTSVTGIELAMHGTIEECNAADLVFFTSGPGTRQLIRQPDYLERFHLDPGRQVIGSMCSGALVLAALGLLDGLTATTYPTAVAQLREFGVEVVSQPLVIHHNLATAAGCLVAIDLVRWMLTRVLHADVATEVLASVQPVGQGLECIY